MGLLAVLQPAAHQVKDQQCIAACFELFAFWEPAVFLAPVKMPRMHTSLRPGLANHEYTYGSVL